MALGCVGAFWGLVVLGVGCGYLCGDLQKKKKQNHVRWKLRYPTNFPDHFWQAGGREKDGVTPEQAAARSDGLVTWLGPANLDEVQAMKTKGPSKLPAAQAAGELSTRLVWEQNCLDAIRQGNT